MWTKTRLELIGSEVQLFCRTQGFPKPSVTWLGPDGKLLTRTDKTTVLDSGDLILRDLSWSDMGGYQCVAVNEDGQDQTTTFLYPVLVSYYFYLYTSDICFFHLFLICILSLSSLQPEKS